MKDMQGIAAERGGKCLSKEYVNSSTKVLWECGEGHQWQATPHDIKRGRWCPKCGVIRRVRGSIKDMQGIAAERGGKCLSKEYVNLYAKLLWKCGEGHQWEAIPHSISRGSWCPKCAVIRRTGSIKDMQGVVAKRGGKCLSTEYVNSSTKLLWECGEGHQWEAIPQSISRGSWCGECYRFKQRGKT